MKRTWFASLTSLALLLAGAPCVGAASADGLLAEANQLVRASGVSGGIITVVGAQDAERALALAKQGSFLVHCLFLDSEACNAARRAIRKQGVYGTVSASTLYEGRLPYAGNLINLVVIVSPAALSQKGVTPKEVARVLAPLGTVFVAQPTAKTGGAPPAAFAAQLQSEDGFAPMKLEPADAWLAFKKPWPKEIDEWGHYLHGADGNPVADDSVVGPPAHLQWIGGPTWLRSHETDSSVSTLVTAQGRLFSIVDEAPISLAGQYSPPDKWSLIARDAFNGVLLWKVPIRRWGWREWKPIWFNTRPGDIPLNIQKRLVAAGDRVYVTLGYQAPVSQLDAHSGEILQSYAGTERTGEILHLDGTLILSVLEGKRMKVMAVNTATGKQLWATSSKYRGTTTDYIKWKEMHGGGESVELDPTLNMATDGRTIAFLDGPDIVGLDGRTGAEKWRTVFPQAEEDKTAGGIRTGGDLWVGTLIVRNGVVIHASPNKLAGLSADSGKVLWSQPKKYIGHLWYEWKDVFVIGDLVWTWGADLETSFGAGGGRKDRSTYPQHANGYDLRTGALKKSVPLGAIFKANHHHRCYRNKATSHYILASRRGTEFVDLEGGHHTVDNWVRSTCHVGMMPANGLQYVPPHPCQCYIDEKLNGFLALASQRAAERFDTNAPPLLVTGPAFGATANRQSPIADTEDWPAYRHDGQRTSATKTRVPDDLAELWRVKAGTRVTPPVVVGNRLFVALTEQHHVVCLDTRSGAKQWEFAAGGRVDSPPTYHQGTILFGSTDGWVYCLRAADGQLAWRFRGAPGERLISAGGQLESTWPVHGSVLVQSNTVYFATGRSSHLDGGLRVYGVAAMTGALRCRALLEGPHFTVDNLKENFKPQEGALPDILMGDGSHVYMRGETFDNDLKPSRGKAPLRVPGGFLDDSYFKRIPWTFGTAANHGRLFAFDDERFCGMRMFDSLRGLDPNVYFTPGQKGYLLFSRNVNGERKEWSNRQPVRVRAMAMASDRVFAAGPPDVVDPKDPLGAFEGRKGGVLLVLNADTGDKVAEQSLPSPPVFNGAAAARGRLYLVDEDGGIACYGTR